MPEAIGGLLGGIFGDKGGGQQQSQTQEPWGPTKQPLTDLINQGQQLNQYYQQNPFNPMQQTGYQNLFGDLDQFRNQIAPGLMGMANRMMGANYQRAPAGTELGAANPYPPGTFSTRPMLASNANMPSGLLGGAMGAASRMQPMNRDQGWQGSVPQQAGSAPSGALAGAMGQSQGMQATNPNQNWLLPTGAASNNPAALQQALGAVFGVNPGQSYGPVIWNGEGGINPYTNGGIKPLPVAKPASDDKANKDYEDFWRWNLGG